MSARLYSMECAAFGVPFRLTANSNFILVRMFECAPLGTHLYASASEKGTQFALLESHDPLGYRLAEDNENIADNPELKSVLEQLARQLMVHVANRAPDRIFLHAGVVGWQGRALILPGTTFAGKTTLVAELVRAGAVYYSDEYAVLDKFGRVHPYPRALQMRQNGSREQTAVPVTQLSGSIGSQPLFVSHIVFTEYAQCGCWRPEPVSAGMAVLEMLRHAIPVQRTPARVMAALAKMMESATAVRTMRGEASETARALLAAMSTGRLSI